MIETVTVELTRDNLIILIQYCRPISTVHNLDSNPLISKYGRYKFDKWFWHDYIYELNINELKEILDELKLLEVI
jgi:hypothetical protein